MLLRQRLSFQGAPHPAAEMAATPQALADALQSSLYHQHQQQHAAAVAAVAYQSSLYQAAAASQQQQAAAAAAALGGVPLALQSSLYRPPAGQLPAAAAAPGSASVAMQGALQYQPPAGSASVAMQGAPQYQPPAGSTAPHASQAGAGPGGVSLAMQSSLYGNGAAPEPPPIVPGMQAALSSALYRPAGSPPAALLPERGPVAAAALSPVRHSADWRLLPPRDGRPPLPGRTSPPQQAAGTALSTSPPGSSSGVPCTLRTLRAACPPAC